MFEIQQIEVLDQGGNVLAVVEGWIDREDDDDGKGRWTGELYTNTATARRLRGTSAVTLRAADGRCGKFCLELAETGDTFKAKGSGAFG